ncbi:flagellar motor switch protein [Planctomycetes bacterium Pan216]|uniref:Flagellar motor switch protein n=1 Tax=Kolteria novifilia TaxID=2527975 RepID=A0A518B7F8_9BACT|nr:flagellar motor switch protein [Planctomycetes bacterium Pan216]
MAEGNDPNFEAALTETGNALAFSLGFPFGDHVGKDDLEFAVQGVEKAEPGKTPADLPKTGALLVHRGKLTPPCQETFRFGWFLANTTTEIIKTQAGSDEALGEKLTSLAGELADVIATDKYTLEESTGTASQDLFGDYLGGELPPETMWLKFEMTGLDDAHTIYLSYPWCVLERMFLPTEVLEARTKEAPSAAATPQAASPPVAATPAPAIPASAATPLPLPQHSSVDMDRIARVLKTQVPLIVTLASQDVAADKLLDLGPGAIIEFEQSCEKPLQFSANNLPIGFGEPVKIGDHFGLKITQIVPPAQRVRILGGKWKF